MSRVLPILFNTDMVRAILDGRKTVTRRVVKPQPKMILSFNLAGYGYEKWTYPPQKAYELWGEKYKWPDNITKEDKNMLWTPPCHVDDILYVREAYSPDYFDSGLAGYRGDSLRGNRNAYKADYRKEVVGDVVPEPKWHPSIHMPKEAARIWLKVTDVRVERLQDISEEQAKAEGIREYSKDGKLWKYAVKDDWWIEFHRKHRKTFKGSWWQDMLKTASEAFLYLWNSTIKKSDLDRYGWGTNPWVWVIEFERCEKPGD